MILSKLLFQYVLSATLMGLMPTELATNHVAATYHDLPVAKITATLPQAEERIIYPTKTDLQSQGMATTAPSALVVDAASGLVMFAKRPDDVRSIGSVTKLMTAMVFLDTQPNLRQMVTLTEDDLIYGGRIYLALNDEISLEDLFAAAMVGSDNTAANALMKFSGLESDVFIAKMNDKARELGLTSTTFLDATGIKSGNVSTARELAKIFASARGYELINRYASQSSVTVSHASGRKITIENTNGLLSGFLNQSPYKILESKTGYLPTAGYVLGSAVEKGGHEIRVIVMGADSKEAREAEVKALTTWAFRVFKWPDQL